MTSVCRRFSFVSSWFLLLAATAQLSSAQSSVTLASTANPSVLGAGQLLASVTPVTATGTVTFFDGVKILGTATVSGGRATLSMALLGAGRHGLYAYYAGDASNAAVASNPLTQVVRAQASSGRFAAGKFLSIHTAAVAADFNNDGKPDLVFPLVDVGFLWVNLNLGNGQFAAVQYGGTTSELNIPLAAADFNGDGKQDIVVRDGFSTRVSLLLGNGDGSLQTARMITFSNTFSGVAGDFNGDGKADVALADGAAGVTVLLGKGDGTFQAPVIYPILNPQAVLGANTVSIGDFNGDGRADLATTVGTVAAVSILQGKPDGTFQPPVSVTLPGVPLSLVIGDFNQDGKADIAVGQRSPSQAAVLLGKGDASFQAAVTYPTTGEAGAIETGDFDGDGNLDLAASDGTTLNILAGKGEGTFQAAVGQPLPSPFFATLIAGDFNGDGRTDLVTRSTLLLGTNLTVTASGGTPQSAPVGTVYPVQLQVTVRDGGTPVTGGLVTFVSAPTPAGATLSSSTALTDATGVARVTATANQFPGSFTVTAVYQGVATTFALTNTTGPPAVLSVVSGSGQTASLGANFGIVLKAKLSDSAGNPVTGATVMFSAPATGATAVLSSATALTDATGVATVTAKAGNISGAYQVVASAGGLTASFSLTNQVGSAITLAATPSPSVFGAPVTLTATVTPSNATGRVTFYDGVAVLGTKALTGGAASLSTVLLQAGRRKLTAYYSGDSNYQAGAASATQVVNAVAAVGFRGAAVNVGTNVQNTLAIGDFNGDGKVDLAVGANPGSQSGAVNVLLGKGDGSFQAPVSYPIGFNGQAIVTADFNGDGNADIVATATDSTFNPIFSVLLGRGDGTFLPALNLPAGLQVSQMAVADLNGDGRPDLVSLSPQLAVSLGNGDGTFRAPLVAPVGTFNGLGTVGDLNGDGKVDVAAMSTIGTVLVLLGNGDGSFQSPLSLGTLTLNGFPTVATADFNGDGKTDLVAANYATARVFLGNGDGTFTGGTSYAVPGEVTTGDFNGDGVIDIAAISQSNLVSLLLGNGDGTFRLSLSYTTSAPPLSAMVADFNGDGRSDLVTSNIPNAFPFGTVNVLLGVPAGTLLTVTGGTPQTALTGSAFATPLQVTVIQDGTPVNGAIVTFAAPATGASASLSATTVATNPAGVATVIATANGTTGTYTVTASYKGVTAVFVLSNTTVGSITAASGTPQSTLLTTPFAKPLIAVVKDVAGNPVAGAQVTFSAPASGATAFIPSGSVSTDALGQAMAQPTANGIAGSYTVTATTGGLSTSFSLTNTAIGSLRPTNGTPQSTAVGTNFMAPLEVTVRDSAGRPVANVPVIFTVPASGASAVLTAVTVLTNVSGVASVTAMANNATGTYQITAGTLIGTTPVMTTFTLTNLPAGSAGSTNLAIGRLASQSSTFPGYTTAGPASAVDGSTDGNFFNGSVTATNVETSPWWQVDLGGSAKVNSVAIWNRTDCCAGRLGDYWVFVSDTPFLASDTPATLANRAGTFSNHQLTAPGPSATIALGGARGRYVRVQLNGTDVLSLSEVQVQGTGGGPATALNLAQGKPATQSSTLAGYPTAVASSAVDGNTDGNFFNGSVTATNLDTNAWWQVDLGSSATVNTVVVSNRTDCCANRLGDYWVFVSDTPFLPTDTPGTLQNRPGTVAMHQFFFTGTTSVSSLNAQGRYVRVQLNGTNFLSLAEVQVYGTPGAAPVNLAQGKAASQSSTYPGIASAAAGTAVDGNTDGNFYNGSVTATNLDNSAWWQLDLGASTAVGSVAIWNRTDCCASRLGDYWVFVSDTPFLATDTADTLKNRAGTFASHQTTAPGPSAAIPVQAQGRYVRVQLTTPGILSLAEVQVF